MNKKQYISPEMSVIAMKTMGMLALSGGDIKSGNADPGKESLSRSDYWDDDE